MYNFRTQENAVLQMYFESLFSPNFMAHARSLQPQAVHPNIVQSNYFKFCKEPKVKYQICQDDKVKPFNAIKYHHY